MPEFLLNVNLMLVKHSMFVNGSKVRKPWNIYLCLLSGAAAVCNPLWQELLLIH